MKKIIAIVLVLLITLTAIPVTFPTTRADEVEDLQKQIDDLNKQKSMSEAATKPLEGQLDSMRKQNRHFYNT